MPTVRYETTLADDLDWLHGKIDDLHQSADLTADEHTRAVRTVNRVRMQLAIPIDVTN